MKQESQGEWHIFTTVVFSDGPGGGNRCPVVLDADEITPTQAKWIADHFCAETVLVQSPTNGAADVAFRFFVPRYETEMCLHGIIAALTVLCSLEDLPNPISIETALGLTIATVENRNGAKVVAIDQPGPKFAASNPLIGQVCRGLAIPEGSVDARLPAISVSTARPKLIVPLRNAQVVDGLEPNFSELWRLCRQYETTGVYPFAASQTGADPVYSARQFPLDAGYHEDPATGVAACALGAYLASFVVPGEDWQSFTILQGRAMGRPSRLEVDTRTVDRRVVQTRVRGSAVIEGSSRLRSSP